MGQGIDKLKMILFCDLKGSHHTRKTNSEEEIKKKFKKYRKNSKKNEKP